MIYLLSALSLLFSPYCFATESISYNLHMTSSSYGTIAVIIFCIAYIFVIAEEFIHMRKSKPVVLTAGIIWILVALEAHSRGLGEQISISVRHNILEYSELFLFLLVAMTYVAAMENRNVFERLRCWLINKHLNFKQLFWITGLMSFFISPIADNLTTALFMSAVCMAVAGSNKKFVALSCTNIVVACNAGGAFSPFGDITTLMVWQNNLVSFKQFLVIFLPSLVSYLIPALIMSIAIENTKPEVSDAHAPLKIGAKGISFLFLMTIASTVILHTFLHLPPVIGMMTGFGYLLMYAFYVRKREQKIHQSEFHPFDIFHNVKRAEWDTLFFFYGVILCVGGLATFGYLHLASDVLYNQWGSSLSAAHSATPANIFVGLLSAVVDNIPVMYAILTMNPDMSLGQWLLVTLTAGIGGSILATGSAAGVALLGVSKKQYTFFKHLKWSWAILLGYFAGVGCHLWLNAQYF